MFTALLAFIFHRPLLHATLKGVLKAAAARQGLTLGVTISGNPLTEWQFKDLQIKPLKDAHPTIDFIQVRDAKLGYSPLGLLLHGPKLCVRAIVAQDVQMRMHTNETAGAKPVDDLHHVLARILSIPALAPESITLEQVEVEVLRDNKPLVLLRDGYLRTRPEGRGTLKVGLLELVNRPPLRGIETTIACSQGKLSIRDLVLSPELRVSKLEFGRRSQEPGKHDLAFTLQGGAGELTVQATTQTRPVYWNVTLDARELETGAIADFLNQNHTRLPEGVCGNATFSGNPTRPHTWEGTAKFSWKTPFSSTQTATGNAEIFLSKGELSLSSLSMRTPESEAFLTGNLLLPKKDASLQSCSGAFTLTGSCGNLGEWIAPANASPARGRLEGRAEVSLNRGMVQIEMRGDAKDLAASFVLSDEIHLEATLSAPVNSGFDLHAIAGNALVSTIKPAIDSPGFSIAMEEGGALISLSEGSLRLWNLQLRDSSNAITGEVVFPISPLSFPSSADLHFKIPNLAGSRLKLRELPVSGGIQGRFTGKLESQAVTGECALAGGSLAWGAFQLQDLRVQASCEKGAVTIKDFAMAWSPREWVRATGSVNLSAPFGYEVDASAQVQRLDRITPLLKQLNWAQQCNGSLEARVNGQGEFKSLTGTGQWSLKLKDASWDNLKFNSVDCSGTYRPGQLVADPLRLTSPNTKFAARVEWVDNTLRIENISLEQWGTPTLSGYLLLPITRDSEGTHWIRDARIAGQLRADKLDIANLYAGAGKPAGVSGSIQCSLALSGTPQAPSAAFHLHANDFRVKAAPGFGAMTVDLKGGYQENTLSAEAKVLSALNAPVLFETKIPLQLNTLFSSPQEMRKLPITARIRTAGATLDPLSKVWTGFRQLKGTASLDASLSGSMESPHWTASLNADCPVIHFASDRAPAINALHLGVEVDDRLLRLRFLKADMGGGSLEIQGTAQFDTPHNPLLNFSAKAKEVLAVRNHSLSLRLNGDLSLRGPWKRAVLGGSAAAVKSRVTWDLELLPLTALMPGFHKEQRTAGKPWFTFSKAPFSDWRFDIGLSTTPRDPIILRGNRLRGTAEAELRLEGSGAAPTLHGAYRTSDLVAALPFAKIEMSRGRVWYTRDQPFLPQVDFNAETEVRNHRIRFYLGGPADTPQISLSSEPPLGETDLLALLTTGALPSDASDTSQALAGRAATVLFQEFSDKVFKPRLGKEPLSALRRFSLDLSALNGRTGHQETRLTYRLTDNFFMIGEIGADGDFAGRVRYVLRFR